MIAVLGAGPHGRQIAYDVGGVLYDDHLVGFLGCDIGLQEHDQWIAGQMWPEARRQFAESHTTPVGCGVYIAPSARIGIETLCGVHVHVLTGAVVSHGCNIGAYSTVATGAILCGEVNVGSGVFIGAGAVVIHGGITIGDNAVVGAGAVITQDVPAGATVKGVPAR